MGKGVQMGSFNLNRRSFLKGAGLMGATSALAALAGCGGSDDGGTDASAGGDTGSEASSYAKTIVIGRANDSDNLDPVTCIGNINIFIFNLILDGLLKTSDDGETIEPNLAEDMPEISDDGLTYTFKVKSGLKFSDGSDVTAEDWKWTFERAMTTEDSNWISTVENFDHVECPDDTTVIVTLKTPAASALACLCVFTLGVQSKAYFDKVGADEYKNAIIGTGPYMVKEWKKGEYLTLTKNPNYREEGLPLTEEIEFKVVADDNSRKIQLQSGDIDIATDVPFSTMKELESDSEVAPHPDPSTFTYWVSLNTQNEYLSNPDVREALFLATDPQEIVDMTTYGYGTTIGTVFSTTSEYCDKDLEPITPDVDKAKELLAGAGYPDGFEIKMLLKGGNDFYASIATVLQSQWSKIGVNLVQDTQEATAYSSARKALELDTIISGWSDDIQDPSEFMQFIFDYDVTNGYYSGLQQPDDMVALNDQANAEQDVEKRKELYKQIQQGFADQKIFIPLLSVPYQNAIRKDITGFVQTPLGNYRFEKLAMPASE